MMYTLPPTEAMAACRRGAFMGAWRTHCLRDRSYSSTEPRWGEPFTTHTFPCTWPHNLGIACTDVQRSAAPWTQSSALSAFICSNWLRSHAML